MNSTSQRLAITVNALELSNNRKLNEEIASLKRLRFRGQRNTKEWDQLNSLENLEEIIFKLEFIDELIKLLEATIRANEIKRTIDACRN